MPRTMTQLNERYTYRDYCTWPDGERWEIIDGIAYDMSPAPSWEHQSICGRLTAFFFTALKGKKCIPMVSPCDVVLSDYDVVQPDLFVVCDESKITPKNLQGAPDLVIEILSPSTSHKDQQQKLDLYEKYRVKEYCIVDPAWQCVYRFALGENNKYGRSDYFAVQQSLPLISLPGLSLPLWDVFGVEKTTTPESVS